jgi:hypothetical protein
MPRKMKGGSLSSSEIKQFVEASYEDNKGKTERIGNYILDKQLSTAKAKVYHDPVNKKTVVANRGTKGTVSDWYNNLQYVRGKYDETDRMKQAIEVQRRAIAKYGKVDYNVGHSQAGIITRKLNEMGLTGQVINLNPASMFEKQKENEYVIRSKTDPVSILHALNPFARKENTTTTSGTSNLLKEHSTDVLTRIDPNVKIGKGRTFTKLHQGKGKYSLDNPPPPTAQPVRKKLPADLLKGGKVSNELTNFEIDDYMKHFKIKNYHGCFIKDELPELNNGFYVINLNGQSHWTCLCKDVKGIPEDDYLYYDSYGFPAPIEVEQAIKKDGGKSYVSMDNQLQYIAHTSCGFYVIAFCKYLNNRKDKLQAYKEFIEHFTEDTETNDQILKKMLDKELRSL